MLIAKFTGRLADEHKLPAYEAVQSLYGLSRSLLIITNYLAEGRVRRRDFKPTGFELNIVAQRPGSFETIFELASDPKAMEICTSLALGAGGNFLTEFIKSIYRRAVGKDATHTIKELEDSGKLKSGDLGALVDAIEPAMREAHKVINHGATTINIINGDNNIILFDAQTKEYVNTSVIDENVRIKLFSVAAFDANSGYGRAFDYEEGRSWR